MIQQMGFWFAKTKGVKRDKQTVTADKQQRVRRVTVGMSVYAFLLQRHINHPLREKSRVNSELWAMPVIHWCIVAEV